MPFNGSGTFNRLFSWVADRNAGIDISSTRMDSDTNDIASGLSDCITRDGQSLPTANLPMNSLRHTGVENGQARTDYAAVGQVQDGLLNWVAAGGTVDAITAAYSPAITGLVDGQICYVRALGANATTTPTFSPNGLAPRTITKAGGTALAVADIGGALYEMILRYNLANTRWELLNPSLAALATAVANTFSTGDTKLTYKTTPDSGWLMFDDGTYGSATSGSSNSNSALNQNLFTLMFNSISDTAAPILTSTGSATTRAAQGTAAAAWAANCRMSLPKTLGRALAVAGAGSGLTSRPLGSIVGEENHLLTAGEVPTINSSGTITVTVAGGNTVPSTSQAGATYVNIASTASTQTLPANSGNTPWAYSTQFQGTGQTMSSTNTGGGSHNNMPPETFLNAMVKV